MGFQTTTTATSTKTLKPAEGWLNVYITGTDGKEYKIGAIPLDNDKPLHARINAACTSKGVEAIEGHVSLNWQPGGTKEASSLNLPF
jgi:predicted GH43/DUF377 family glycosyl hydrolase